MRISLALAFALLFEAQGLWGQPRDAFRTDDRYRADLLLVVAHPDDETLIGSYLARAIFDEHRRVAVVFGTRGNSGGNAIGSEQGASLGAMREIEARRALAYFGVMNVWFLDAPDTPGQDVLRSLETWDHGRALAQLVRVVRLTRPTVIATWLPDYVAGENHGDHQAAGVLATEAFDSAGDPTQYPEQVTPPRDPRDILNLTEGLHPWQAQKLYYFSDASHVDFLKGRGPRYEATDVSSSKHVSYAQLAAEECAFHLTQSDSGYTAKAALEKSAVDKTYLHDPVLFIFAKSHVEASVTGDLFQNVLDEALPYKPPPGFQQQSEKPPTFTLGGPWHYYKQFWRAHGLEHLAKLVAPEVQAGVSTAVRIPILLENGGNKTVDGDIAVEVPAGWTLRSGGSRFAVKPGETFAGQVVAMAPNVGSESWHEIKITATSNGERLGVLPVRVLVTKWSLPQ